MTQMKHKNDTNKLIVKRDAVVISADYYNKPETWVVKTKATDTLFITYTGFATKPRISGKEISVGEIIYRNSIIEG